MTHLQATIKAKAADLCATPEGRYQLPEGHPITKRVENAIYRYYETGLATWKAIRHYHHITDIPLSDGLFHPSLRLPMATSHLYGSRLKELRYNISALERAAMDSIFHADQRQVPLTENYRNNPEHHLITAKEAKEIRQAIETTPHAYAPLIERLEKRPHFVMKNGKITVGETAFHKALNEDLLGGVIKRAIDIAKDRDKFVFFVFHKPYLKQLELDSLALIPRNTQLLTQELAAYLHEHYTDDFKHSFMGSQAMRSLKRLGQGKELSYHEERFIRQLPLQPVFKEKINGDDAHHFDHLNHLLDVKSQLGTWLQKALEPKPEAAHLYRA